MYCQSVHAPFAKMDRLWYPDEFTEPTIQRLLQGLQACIEAGVPIMVLHAFITFDRNQATLITKKERTENVKGVYTVVDPDVVKGKHILLLDDIITTGATPSDCARVLLTAGAKEVICAAIAAANHQQKNQ